MTIIVIRYTNKLRQSKPCKQCCEKLKQLGIKTIIYSTDEPYLISERVRDICSEHLALARRFGFR